MLLRFEKQYDIANRFIVCPQRYLPVEAFLQGAQLLLGKGLQICTGVLLSDLFSR